MRTVQDFGAPASDEAEQGLIAEVALAADARAAVQREIARQLHDAVIQPLTALVMGLGMQQQAMSASTTGGSIGLWHELAQEALDALRATLAGECVHPHARLALPDAIQQHLIPRFEQCGLQLRLECTHWPSTLSREWTSSLYLAVREAVANAEKHGHASQVSITLLAEANRLLITVVDNGTGIAPIEVSAVQSSRPGHGLGLQGMRERVRQLGGSLQVMAAPNGGTRVEMCIPCPDIMPSHDASVRQRSGPRATDSHHVH